jgi:hypothetical protein
MKKWVERVCILWVKTVRKGEIKFQSDLINKKNSDLMIIVDL